MQPIPATDPLAQSANLIAANIAALKALFPELITETVRSGQTIAAINPDVLKQLIGDAQTTDSEEKYGLNWHGKRRARQIALTPSTGTLRPDRAASVDWDSTQNLMIEGDNLEVLKLLQKSYAGKVKLIYIDPPYNTGKDFVYPDHFQDNIKNYLEITGQLEGGQKISTNTEDSGRFHTDWLNMMYPRLKLARDLLDNDGVIFISCDDNEISNIKFLCDDVFQENYIGVFVKPTTGGKNPPFYKRTHEYLLAYAKSVLTLDSLNPWSEITSFETQRSLRKDGDSDKREDRPEMHYSIFSSLDGKVLDLERFEKSIEITPLRPDGSDGRWRWGKEKFRSDRHRLVLKQKTNGLYDINVVTQAGSQKQAPWNSIISSNTAAGGNVVNNLFGTDGIFSYPKNPEYISWIINKHSDKNALILDFFAGSGTTAHAVMAQNAADGGTRRCILVQLPEPLDPANKEQKTAADFCDRLGAPRTIAELTKERLRRAGAKVKADNPLFAGDVGFRAFKLDTSNIRAWNTAPSDVAQQVLDHQEHLLAGRSSDDVLYELLLKLGLDLCVPITEHELGDAALAGCTVHAVGGGTLLACLATRITAAQAEPLALAMVALHHAQVAAGLPKGATSCLFRDSAFENDIAKTNLTAILAQHGLAQVRSV